MYDAKNAEKIEKIPAGEVVEGVIIDIADGTARKFIKTETGIAKYKNLDEPHINVTIEFLYKDRRYQTDQMFSYIIGSEGKVLYTENSNLGKFNKFYKTLPDVGTKVKLSSNADGYFKLMY